MYFFSDVLRVILRRTRILRIYSNYIATEFTAFLKGSLEELALLFPVIFIEIRAEIIPITAPAATSLNQCLFLHNLKTHAATARP